MLHFFAKLVNLEFTIIDDYSRANVFDFFPLKNSNLEFTADRLIGGCGLTYKMLCYQIAKQDVKTTDYLYKELRMSEVYSYNLISYAFDKLSNQ